MTFIHHYPCIIINEMSVDKMGLDKWMLISSGIASVSACKFAYKLATSQDSSTLHALNLPLQLSLAMYDYCFVNIGFYRP